MPNPCICHTLYAIRHALSRRLRQAPSRCLVLADAAEVISRASCPSPHNVFLLITRHTLRVTVFAIRYMLYAMRCFTRLQHMPRRNLVLADAAEVISMASCPSPHNVFLLIIRHTLRVTVFAIRYMLYAMRCLVGFGRYPLDVWSSLTLRRSSRGHPALRLTMFFC